jgi:hypothetical protein
MAMLVLFGAALTAAASAQPHVLDVACAKQHGGRLRYVSSARTCRRGERPVRFNAPVHTCVGAHRVVLRARRCRRGHALVLPAAKRRVLCADRRTRVVRYRRCRARREFKVVVMGRVVAPPPVVAPVAPVVADEAPVSAPPMTSTTPPPTTTTPPPAPPPVALGDEATTDEDSAVVVNVLDNDTSQRVTDLDTSSTVGAVTANPDGTISYDPRGRFDDLGPTELATDTFTKPRRTSPPRSRSSSP